MAEKQAMNRRRHYEEYEYKGQALTKDNVPELLAAWMRDMKAWGQEVRDDIIRLESAVGAAAGDPGDPPPAPRGKN